MDLIIAKAHLHLGRLTFASNMGSHSACTSLQQFYKKVKSADNKELIDIGRVNLGMHKGTEKMNELKQQIKEWDYKKFLASKLEIKSNQ
ncbi:MAG: hypothetical protein MJ252_27225 [archaeon]|nr:hypothetical protein [archaeon]